MPDTPKGLPGWQAGLHNDTVKRGTIVLTQTGELLAATTDNVTRRSDNKEFTIRKVTVFDTDTGQPVVLGCGLNFGNVDFNDLVKLAAERPHVRLQVSLYRDQLQVDKIVDVVMPASKGPKVAAAS